MTRPVLFLLFLFPSLLGAEEFFSLSAWKKHIEIQEKNPRPWVYALRQRFPKEIVGKFLACYGNCFFRHHTGHYRGHPLFSIKEGDELFTDSRSYLWIFLLDGTLVRLSPDSSISFQEMAMGTKDFFFSAQLNRGNILWLPRYPQTHKFAEVRETDTLFLPMEHLLPKHTSLREIYENLNKKIKENNAFVRGKPTYSFLSTRAGSFYGKNIYGEFTVFPQASSLFKLRPPTKELSKQEKPAKVTFYPYGPTAQESFHPEHDQWYQTNPHGKEPNPYPYGQQFSLGEYATRHIPSILLAREILLKRYSPFAFYLLRHKTLAERFGYYRFSERELAKRLAFLKTYTKSLETARFSLSSPLPTPSKINKKFYQQAINHYFFLSNSGNSDTLKEGP